MSAQTRSALGIYRNIIVASGDNGLPTVSVSSAVAEAFLRDALLNKQLRIEIWTQSRGTWQLSRKASPGNLQDVEDLLFLSANLTAAPVVLAAKVTVSGEHKTVGVAFADATTKEIGVSEFIDNDLYSNFEVWCLGGNKHRTDSFLDSHWPSNSASKNVCCPLMKAAKTMNSPNSNRSWNAVVSS